MDLELRYGLAEVRAGGRLDTERPVTEVHLVEVHLQYSVLGVAALQLEGEDSLLQLPLQALVGREEQHLGELLGDGAATFHDPTPAVILDDGPGDPDGIQAPV